MNKLTIIGNVTKDAEARTTQTGVNVCSFTVAVNKKKKKGEQNETDYFRVTAWRGLADICGQYVKKGSKVCVVGPVSVSTYTNNNGETKASLEVTADDVEFLSSKGEGGSRPSQQEDFSEAPVVPQQSQGFTDVTEDLEGLPF